MPFSRRAFTIVALATLAGCAQAPARRLVATARAPKAVRVYVWAAGDPALQRPGVERLVQTLQVNALPVSDFVLLEHPFANLDALQRAWSERPGAGSPTHALVFTQQRLDNYGGAKFVRYEAVLWDAETRALVWQSTLGSAANQHGVGPEQRAERLAGDTLRGLAAAGLIALPAPDPRDASGLEIPATRIPLQIL